MSGTSSAPTEGWDKGGGHAFYCAPLRGPGLLHGRRPVLGQVLPGDQRPVARHAGAGRLVERRRRRRRFTGRRSRPSSFSFRTSTFRSSSARRVEERQLERQNNRRHRSRRAGRAEQGVCGHPRADVPPDRGPERSRRSALDRRLRPGPLHPRRRSGPGQDVDGAIAGRSRWRSTSTGSSSRPT